MKRINLLTKLFLKNMGPKDTKTKIILVISLILGGLFFVIPLSLLFFAVCLALFSAFPNPEQMGTIYGVITLAILLVMFIYSFFSVPSFFYFSADVPKILAMPFTSKQIVVSKFIITTMFEYILMFSMFLPMSLAFLFAAGFSVWWLLATILGFLTLPIIAVSIAAIMVMLLMRMMRFVANKEIFSFVSGLLAIGLSIGANIFIQLQVVSPAYAPNLETFSSLTEVIDFSSINGLLNYSVFPQLLGNGASGSKLAILGYAVATVALFWLFTFVADKLYLKTVVDVANRNAKKKKLSNKQFMTKTKTKKTLIALCHKEYRMLTRSGTYVLNLILSSFIIPCLLMIPFLTQNSFVEYITNTLENGLVVEVWIINCMLFSCFAMGYFIGGTNCISATSISREGQNFFVAKVIPVPLSKQLLAKGIVGYLFGMIPFLLLIIIGGIGLNIAPTWLFGGTILGLIGIALSNALQLVVASIKPNLVWTNEVEVAKKGASMYMGVMLSFLGLGIFSLYLLLIFIPPAIFISGLLLFGVGLSIVSWIIAVKLFNNFAQKY
ncbi:MAG: hypothetical protein ACRC6X_00440 [Culicoidibacterales bacterium]